MQFTIEEKTFVKNKIKTFPYKKARNKNHVFCSLLKKNHKSSEKNVAQLKKWGFDKNEENLVTTFSFRRNSEHMF